MSDIGNGLDQPILELGADFAIFETEDGYVMRQFGEGDLADIPADVSDDFWKALKKQGWTEVNYE